MYNLLVISSFYSLLFVYQNCTSSLLTGLLMYTIRYITYLRNRRVFPGRSLGLLSFLALEFGDTVLFGSVVMSFALDEHPCPSTVSQTQKKRLVSHHCFFFPLFSRE